MKANEYFILMADIIDSRNTDQKQLMHDFKGLVKNINKKKTKSLLSPLTITLGDEFQSVLKELTNAIETIIDIEEMIITERKAFKLRYVLYQGKIETPINRNIAYGMLGPGLTHARETLRELKSSNNRFYIHLQKADRAKALNNSLFILQNFIDNWRLEKDYEIVSQFLVNDDYKTVAKKLHKEPSLMWKRKKSLNLEEYNVTKEIIKYLVNE